MKSKVLLPLVGLMSLVAVAGPAFVFRPLPTSITAENARRVKPGMTFPQVTSILGEPRAEAPDAVKPSPRFSPYTMPNERHRWVGESWIIVVETDLWDKVVTVDVSEHRFGSAWEHVQWRIRRVLGLAPDAPTAIETNVRMLIR